jgi:DNA-binding protein HU-beta
MTQSEIYAELAEKNEISKKQAAQVVDSLVELAYREAGNGFKIPGLGKLEKKQRKARMGRNPATGETIKIPAKTVLKFRVAKAAKDKIL